MNRLLAYEILTDRSLILETYNGMFDVDELIEFKKHVGSDEKYNPNFDVIHDFRNIEFNLQIKEINKYIDLLKTDNRYQGDRRSAMVTATPNQVVTTMGFDMLKRNLNIDVRVCSTLENAFSFVQTPKKDWKYIKSRIDKLKISKI